MAQAAKERLVAGLNEFDSIYSVLEGDVQHGLPYNDAVKRINALIAFLNPLSQHFGPIGGTGIKEDVDCANDLIGKFNAKMKSLEALAARAKQNLPPPVTTSVSLAPPPQRPAAPKLVAEETVEAPVLVPLPPDVANACREFNNLWDACQRLTPEDVWTGKSNDLVNSWSSFCQTQAPALSRGSGLKLQKDALAVLNDVIPKFNTFANTLTTRINSLNINDHQKQVITRFGPEHDNAMQIFKQHINSGNMAILDSQYLQIQNLERGLRALRIDNHPQVRNHLSLCRDSLAKMDDVFQHHKRNAHLANQMVQQPVPVASSVGLTQRYEDPQPVYEEPVYNAEVELSLPPPKPKATEPTQQSFPKFCPECGTGNNGKRFCGECGHQFGSY